MLCILFSMGLLNIKWPWNNCICHFSFDKCKCIKQINSGSSLESLGTLVAGVPSESLEKIPASQLLSISQSSTFVSNMLAAPTVVQQTFVKQVRWVHFWFYHNITAIILKSATQHSLGTFLLLLFKKIFLRESGSKNKIIYKYTSIWTCVIRGHCWSKIKIKTHLIPGCLVYCIIMQSNFNILIKKHINWTSIKANAA